jgi:hypothetical protein
MCRAFLAAVLALPAALAAAGPPPPPDWRPEPPPDGAYEPTPAVIVQPAVVYVEPTRPPAPPPLPTAIRILYAPFYVAALTIRYGLYYGIVVPLEVFGRTLAYGFEGGVAGAEGNKEDQR